MEAATLKRKKSTISKGKLKKNIKNVLCRPDQVFWPELTEDQAKKLVVALRKYRVQIPEFKKLHWKELKLIPKEERPKPPRIPKVEGLVFGISECSSTIQDGLCSAIIIESKINPRMIVLPVIEMCISKSIPLLCLTDLRIVTMRNFGVKTSCLGLKTGYLPDFRNEILEITKLHPMPKSMVVPITNNKKEHMNLEVQETKTNGFTMDISEKPYLYRTDKKTRVFVPISQESLGRTSHKFTGQDFIELSNNVKQQDSKSYMKMILKRITNNPDRVKKKKSN